MRATLLAALYLAASSAIPAQDAAPERLRSGPPAGSELRPVVVYAAVGPRAGLEFDAAKIIGDGPGALLFIHEITRNVAPLIREIDRLAQSHRPLGLDVFAIRIAPDRTEAERRVQAVSRSLNMTNPIVVSVDGAEGPGDWALNRRCTLTLVVTNDGKVHKSIGFTDTGRQDAGLLRSVVEEVTGPLPKNPGELRRLAFERLPDDPAALRALAAQLALEQNWQSQLANASANRRPNQRRDRAMRGQAQAEARPGADRPKREGAPPEDAELASLLRSFIRKDAPAERIAEVFASIEKRVGDDAVLRRQAVEMFRLVLSLDYGNEPAQEKARAYVREHGSVR